MEAVQWPSVSDLWLTTLSLESRQARSDFITT